MLNGGASRDRTDDPLLAKQVLSQLSYGPIACLFEERSVQLVREQPSRDAIAA